MTEPADRTKLARPLSFDPEGQTLAYETTPTGRVHAFDPGSLRGDRASYVVLDDAGWFWEPARDPRPRDHPEPPPHADFPMHVNCRCALVTDARTAIVDHVDFSRIEARMAAAYGLPDDLLFGGTPAPWSTARAEDILADLEQLMTSVPNWRDQTMMGVARHGPWGGLSRYGKPYAGVRIEHHHPKAPLSKRARRRARGKARNALAR